MKPMDAAANLHNALSTIVSAYGSHFHEAQIELLGANETIAAQKKMMEMAAKRIQLLEEQREEASKRLESTKEECDVLRLRVNALENEVNAFKTAAPGSVR